MQVLPSGRRPLHGTQLQQISPYFNPTYTRTGWIGQPPVLDRHEVVTIDGDVDTLGQATPTVTTANDNVVVVVVVGTELANFDVNRFYPKTPLSWSS